MGVVFLFLVLDFGLKYLSEQGRSIRCVFFSIVSVLQLSVPVLQCNPGQRCNMALPLVTMGLVS